MVEGQEGVAWEQWLALARACEKGGLEGLFRSDHYVSTVGCSERGSLDAWATLAGLAAVTRRIRLGTMVSPATFRHPSELAKVVVTVDHISGGRVELGLGAGWYDLEHRSYGFSFHDVRTRIASFAEQLEIVHRQWTEEEFDFDGRFYRLTKCRAEPKPLQRPHPPIIVGGYARPGTVRPAVRFADEYNVPFATADECRRSRSRIDAACEQAGRDPATITFSLMTGFVVGRDEKDLLQRALRVMEWENAGGDPARFVREKRDEWVVGTVGEVIEKLVELEAAGVERIYLEHLDYSDVDAVALLAEEIVPVLTAKTAAGTASDPDR
jgi:F420-dependent oxidoreductase-like protein